MTVLENVRVAATFGGRFKNPEQKAKELLDFVSFPLDFDKPVSCLNVVQLKRLELARVLATNCKLLLLDEVAAGLTHSELPDYIKLIKQIRDSGVTIICIEHVMKFIMELSDNIVVLNFGKIIAEDIPKMITKNEFVKDAYLGKEHLH
jgi:branched-chain amino acid transport system ATP-binding protein